ncbi:c-5 sterol desaturase [Diplodia corticola]|uniref:C-5 sterol desaturase n=1 Tax=Diplodia corticola TaxID=236234 RepID=A0A1J9QUJ3_9PEZI|nr:c-5 sterol desaturase [Diplodia corticola]OJD31650.1 c-5 sterol desaturase [Diplodia corticola]
MDVVLEAFDTYLFDYIYAFALPSPAASLGKPAAVANASYAAIPEMPSPANAWQFEPASQYLSFPPSDYAWMSCWARDNLYRQALSLFLITWIFGLVVYFLCATFSYVFVFDKATFAHPKYLKNQISLEIAQTMRSMPIMSIFTTPFFVLEVRGFSKMYDATQTGPGMWYDMIQFPFFIIFTDFCIYWIHRWLHHPKVYKYLHKPHHKWIMPSPFASHAFHPLDGFAQSLPYHVFPFIFPLQKFAYVALFAFVNIWTVMIHDGEYIAESPVINGAACHTMHHLYFNYNYGQYTTLWDRLGGSYRKPNDELFRKELKMAQSEWEKQSKEMEAIVKEVEGEDDRTYDPDPATSKKQQ